MIGGGMSLPVLGGLAKIKAGNMTWEQRGQSGIQGA